jgi:hypothetical protein
MPTYITLWQGYSSLHHHQLAFELTGEVGHIFTVFKQVSTTIMDEFVTTRRWYGFGWGGQWLARFVAASIYTTGTVFAKVTHWQNPAKVCSLITTTVRTFPIWFIHIFTYILVLVYDFYVASNRSNVHSFRNGSR